MRIVQFVWLVKFKTNDLLLEKRSRGIQKNAIDDDVLKRIIKEDPRKTVAETVLQMQSISLTKK